MRFLGDGRAALRRFLAKYMVINGALATGYPWLAGVFIIGAVMTVII